MLTTPTSFHMCLEERKTFPYPWPVHCQSVPRHPSPTTRQGASRPARQSSGSNTTGAQPWDVKDLQPRVTLGRQGWQYPPLTFTCQRLGTSLARE